MDRRPRVAFAMNKETHASAFSPHALAELAAIAEVVTPEPLIELRSDHALGVLAETEVLLTGWGAPPINMDTLTAAPRLRALVHAAGTVRTFLDPKVFDHGLRVSSSASANAVPVAEFALACTIFGLKRTSRFIDQLRVTHDVRDPSVMPPIGSHRVTVGVVGASRVGREFLRLLRVLDVEVLLSDPYLTDDEGRALGATMVDLSELCRRSEVVSLHAPLTELTAGMIGARELALMRDGTILVNTARGALVDTPALTAELVSGRLDAYLDVVHPEPLPADSPLYHLPNVTLTPHIAGALGNEISRLGELAVAELARFVADGTFSHEVRQTDFGIIA